jgi:hypothetical protein
MKVLPKTMTDGYDSWWHVGVAEVSEQERRIPGSDFRHIVIAPPNGSDAPQNILFAHRDASPLVLLRRLQLRLFRFVCPLNAFLL